MTENRWIEAAVRMGYELSDDYEPVRLLATELARRHLEEARTEGLQLQGRDIELHVAREAARILRNAAAEIDAEYE